MIEHDITTIGYLSLILLVEAAYIIYAVRGDKQFKLRGVVLINMILIGLFAPKLFSLDGVVSNVANLFYASIFCAQTIVQRNFGAKEANANVGTALAVMSLVFVLTYLLGHVPMVDPQRPISAAIVTLTTYQVPVIVASYIAFAVSQSVLILMLRTIDGWRGIILATLVGQTVDSAIFFPIAFSDLPMETILIVGLTGFATKVVCAVALAPVYYLANRP